MLVSPLNFHCFFFVEGVWLDERHKILIRRETFSKSSSLFYIYCKYVFFGYISMIMDFFCTFLVLFLMAFKFATSFMLDKPRTLSKSSNISLSRDICILLQV